MVTLAAFVGVPYFVHTAKHMVRSGALVMGLILAGVAGNFWDRMIYGYVRDFIDVHTPPAGVVHDLFQSMPGGRTVWPTFNVADMFITSGAAAIVIYSIFLDPERKQSEEEGETADSESDATGDDSSQTG